MDHETNLRFLYKEYKSCLLSEFNDYLIRDDTFKSYEGKCVSQQKDILEYLKENYDRVVNSRADVQQLVNQRVEKFIGVFDYYGWTGKQTKNMYIDINIVLLIIMKIISTRMYGLMYLILIRKRMIIDSLLLYLEISMDMLMKPNFKSRN